MDKLGVLEKGITPCEFCGAPSTTLFGGEYVCNSCENTQREKHAEQGHGLMSGLRKSFRTIIEEVKTNG